MKAQDSKNNRNEQGKPTLIVRLLIKTRGLESKVSAIRADNALT